MNRIQRLFLGAISAAMQATACVTVDIQGLAGIPAPLPVSRVAERPVRRNDKTEGGR
jgi:hypothetical protein